MSDKKTENENTREPSEDKKDETSSAVTESPSEQTSLDEQDVVEEQLADHAEQRPDELVADVTKNSGEQADEEGDGQALPAAPEEPHDEGATAAADKQTSQEKSTTTETPAASPKGGGKLLASLGLLLALAAVAGVAFLYWQLIYLKPIESLSTQVQSQQQDNSAQFTSFQNKIQTQIDEVNKQLTAQVNNAVSQQSEELSEVQSQVHKSLNEALLAAPPSQREWKIAEAEYLLRIANHRVLMEQDSNGALQLLLAVDSILLELDDYSMHEVRARLADEIVALKQVRRDDLQGIFLRIEGVSGQLVQLTFNTPAYLSEKSTETEEDILGSISQQFSELLRFRTVTADAKVKALLAPQEESYLELNLRLSLQQAQLAALKRHQGVYESSLLNTRDWILQYMQQDHVANGLVEELETLAALQLARPLPDISGSLTALLEAVRTGL